MSAPHRVRALRRIALAVPDIEECERFYVDVWKLKAMGREGSFAALRTAGASHNDLLLSQGPAGIHHICFSAGNRRELTDLSGQLTRAGVTVRSLTEEELLQGDLEGVQFEDTDERVIRLVVPDDSPVGAADSADPLAPREIGHVVLWTPNQARAESFYGLLGFQVTDRTHMGMSFMRCNADHHTVALVKSPGGKVGIQHIAFNVGTIDNVMRNYARLRQSALTCVWGVGRHGPGNNVFSYYTDPAGNFIEYYGDMEAQPEEFPRQERYWGPEHKGDIWGVAGMPPEAFRA